MNTIHRWRSRLAAACCAALTALTFGWPAAPPPARAGTATAASGSGGSPVVPTGGGPVRGTTAGTVNEFLGIPYAAPPVGNLRWRPPQPPARWRGVRDAIQFGPSCPQPPGPFAPPAPFSEDCLYLNVYTPARTGNDMGSGGRGGRPVIVWIHGGGLTKGQAATTTPPSWRGGRHRGCHDQLPARRAWLPRAPGAGVAARRPVRQLRADGPAGRAALGPGQHPPFRRRPRQRHHRGPVGGRPVRARPDGLTRRPRAVRQGDHPKRVLRAQPAAPRCGRGGRRGLRRPGGLPGPDRGLPAQPARLRPGQPHLRRDPRRRRRQRPHRADRDRAGRRAVRPGAGPQRHQPRRGTDLRQHRPDRQPGHRRAHRQKSR